MPYRAPELFDVKTGTTLDEKVDIWVRVAPGVLGLFSVLTGNASTLTFWWPVFLDPPRQSLGCTLFALAYNYSPFEDPAAGGGSIAMAVGSGRYRHPSSSPYSKAFWCVRPPSV
jgi:serine/threonine kinase 16